MVKGNLVKAAKQGKFDVIAHGCNCQCTMGSGIAKEIRKVFPGAYTVDCKTKKGDASKLGSCTVAHYSKVDVVNCYTQIRYGKRGTYVNYDAVRSCMKWINDNYKGKKVGLPKIGCGLAGGSWGVVRLIIEEELTDVDLTVMYL
jgi:O-acetyl-ADP-ribose deacetylase (regulator of RNase III)